MALTHSSFHLEMDDILLEIKELSRNMFIERYVNVPKASILRLKLLNIFLHYAAVPQHVRKIYGVTTGLIQLGLDIHETISVEKETNVNQVRNRQLSILAGDYYSSQYYFLLSKNNMFNEVKKLAKGIRNINIAKMMLYTGNSGQGFDSIQEFSDLVKIRESNLYVQFLDVLQSDKENSLWKVILENMIFLYYLNDDLQTKNMEMDRFSYYLVNYFASVKERKEIQKTDSSTEKHVKLKKLVHKYNIQRKIEDIIQKLYIDLNQLINQLEDSLIKKELLSILHQHNQSRQTVYHKTPANI